MTLINVEAYGAARHAKIAKKVWQAVVNETVETEVHTATDSAYHQTLMIDGKVVEFFLGGDLKYRTVDGIKVPNLNKSKVESYHVFMGDETSTDLVFRAESDDGSNLVSNTGPRHIDLSGSPFSFLNSVFFAGLDLFGSKFGDTFVGSKQADTFSGRGGNDEASGGGGADFLQGGGKNDTLSGENGKDILLGNAGADDLDGGKHKDILVGGAGRDGFHYAKNYGRDTVGDFQNNKDTVYLNDNLWTGNKTVRQILNQFGEKDGSDFVLDFGGGNELRLVDTKKSELRNDIEIV